MRRIRPSLRRALRWIGIFLIALPIGLYFVLPIAVGIAAVWPAESDVGAPPVGFEAISLDTVDGVTLSAWYLPPANGAAILLLHGAGGSRETLRPYAEILARRGYGVLALDLRGHGTSGGVTNRLGWQGNSDVGASLAYLQAQPDVQRIGGLGLSMGAEVLLGAASANPAITAIVADGATRRSVDELLALPSERPLVRNFTARVMYAAVRILSGDDPPPPLQDSMIAAKSTDFLLIAGGAEGLEVDFNTLFAQSLGDRATLWVVPDAPHTGGFERDREAYAARVLAFFDEVLVGESANEPNDR
jgi:dienelactone hydrolase